METELVVPLGVVFSIGLNDVLVWRRDPGPGAGLGD